MSARLVAAILGAAGRLARYIPLSVSYRLASLVGRAAYLLWPRGRRSAIGNYQVMTGGDVGFARDLAGRSFENYGRYLVDFLRLPRLRPEEIGRAVVGDSAFALLDRAREGGRGAVIACMHYGGWDFGAAAASVRGYPLSVVIETFDSASLDAAVVRSREALGMKVIRMERPLSAAVKALRRGELLAVLVDRPLQRGGVTVPFFGREVRVPAGAARLARSGRAVIIPAAFVRLPDRPGTFQVLAGEPIVPPCTDDGQADAAEATRLVFRAHERFILKAPDQWYMFRSMWPEGRGGR
ncbi:MAG: lysophospholipid acyltransferase family protein [Dehalococcoidia bacterium]